MIIHTASEGISLSRELENSSAGFYEKLAQRYKKGSEAFLSFISENKKNVVQLERAYYGVITDAIEGGYAFNLDTDDYSLSLELPDGTGYADALNQAKEMESIIIRFYEEAAEQSRSLLADVPRAFSLIARKRKSRIEQLESLSGN